MPTREAAREGFLTPPSTTVENTKKRYTMGRYTKVNKQCVGGDERSVPESAANIAWPFGARNASGVRSSVNIKNTKINEIKANE